MSQSPTQILRNIYLEVNSTLSRPRIGNPVLSESIEYICRCLSNRAGVRLLMACMIGKIDQPHVDPREPYTEIGGECSFSGRTYDERYLTPFISEFKLPCNPTTAFLTPALRNIDSPLTKEVVIVGRPARVYTEALNILDSVVHEEVEAEDVLAETIRVLCIIRNEKKSRMKTLLADIQKSRGGFPLPSEVIINLITQHLACKNASRLPVLVIAAAYQTVGEKIGERLRKLHVHNAADKQTGAMGDVEICLESDDHVVTVYEVKFKRVTRSDIVRAVTKIVEQQHKIDNYIFITTEVINEEVNDYARSLYDQLGGIEVVVLDCLGFLRHFLHFFHRLRTKFLENYQELLLAEPDSSVNQPLKEAFLVLRHTAESDE